VTTAWRTQKRAVRSRAAAASDTAVGAARLRHGRGAIMTAPLRHGVGAGTWQPRGYGLLTSGPGAERERLTGGTP
jgi:hypothetical protein